VPATAAGNTTITNTGLNTDGAASASGSTSVAASEEPGIDTILRQAESFGDSVADEEKKEEERREREERNASRIALIDSYGGTQ